MRCPDCCKFVGLENGEPEMGDFEINVEGEPESFSVTISGSATLGRNCADCGTTLKSGDFEFDEEITTGRRRVVDAEKAEKMGKRLDPKPCKKCNGKKVYDAREDHEYILDGLDANLKGDKLKKAKAGFEAKYKAFPCERCQGDDGKPTGLSYPPKPLKWERYIHEEIVNVLRPHVGDGHELSVEAEPGDVDESGGGRYSANTITVSADYKISCSCGVDDITEGTIGAELTAGSFEEQV